MPPAARTPRNAAAASAPRRRNIATRSAGVTPRSERCVAMPRLRTASSPYVVVALGSTIAGRAAAADDVSSKACAKFPCDLSAVGSSGPSGHRSVSGRSRPRAGEKNHGIQAGYSSAMASGDAAVDESLSVSATRGLWYVNRPFLVLKCRSRTMYRAPRSSRRTKLHAPASRSRVDRTPRSTR